MIRLLVIKGASLDHLDTNELTVFSYVRAPMITSLCFRGCLFNKEFEFARLHASIEALRCYEYDFASESTYTEQTDTETISLTVRRVKLDHRISGRNDSRSLIATMMKTMKLMSFEPHFYQGRLMYYSQPAAQTGSLIIFRSYNDDDKMMAINKVMLVNS